MADVKRKLNQEGQAMLAVSGSPEVVLIRVPQLPRAGDCLAAITALLRLQEEGSATASWVVDLSELRPPPLSLVGVLVGLRARFRELGRELKIVGVQPMSAGVRLSREDDMAVHGPAPAMRSALAAN